MSERIPVIFDTDIGIDDAYALLLAAGNPTLKLLGITTCFGNTSLDNCNRNALQICELLGLDPLYCANEGRMLAVVSPEKAEAVLTALRHTPGGEGAAIIGEVNTRWSGKVTLQNEYGANRILTKLTGAQLPRIC